MSDRRAELDDLHAGAYVADRGVGCMYEIVERRTHRENPKAAPVEQVKLVDVSFNVGDPRGDPDWSAADELVGLELVRAAPVRSQGQVAVRSLR